MSNRFANPAENNLAKNFTGKREAAADKWTIRHIGAGVGLLGGTFLLASGVFLTVFQFFYREEPHGSWLFAVVLPLWIIGAHCFDKIEETSKARRIERCRQTGMNDEECPEQELTQKLLNEPTEK